MGVAVGLKYLRYGIGTLCFFALTGILSKSEHVITLFYLLKADNTHPDNFIYILL